MTLRRVLPPVVVLVLLVVSIAAFLAWRPDRLLSIDGLQERWGWLSAEIDRHPLGAPLAVIGFDAIGIAVAWPVAALTAVFAGLAFGTLSGGLYAVAGSTFGAAMAYILARFGFYGLLLRWSEGWLDTLRKRLGRNIFGTLLVLRLIPVVPFWLVNYGAGLLGLRLITLVGATVLGVIPSALIYARLGHAIRLVLEQGGRPAPEAFFGWEVLGPLFALAALAGLPVLFSLWRSTIGMRLSRAERVARCDNELT